MKLYELSVGQRFTFTDKHRGKVFKIESKSKTWARYIDVATGEARNTNSRRKTFRMDVLPVTEDKVVTLTERDVKLLSGALYGAYLEAKERNGSERFKSELNNLHCKITGLPGRRRILPEGE